MRVELVEWLDTGLAVNDGWMSSEYVRSKAHHMTRPVVSTGIVMYEDDECVILAGAYASDTDQYLNAHAIMKQSIMGRHSLYDKEPT